MQMNLDLVPARGGNAAIILRHYDADGEGNPILMSGSPGDIIAIREKVRQLIESLEATPKKARKRKAKAEIAEVKPEKKPKDELATPRQPRLTEEQEKRILELHEDEAQEMSPLQIAEDVGCDVGQVSRLLKKKNLL